MSTKRSQNAQDCNLNWRTWSCRIWMEFSLFWFCLWLDQNMDYR